MTNHLYPDCLKCPYFAYEALSADQISKLKGTIDAQQQEIKRLQTKLEDWRYETQCHMDEVIARDKLRAQVTMLREALEKAVSTIEMIHPMSEDEPCIVYEVWNDARKALAKAKGGTEHA